jgi:hypothetical protein
MYKVASSTLIYERLCVSNVSVDEAAHRRSIVRLSEESDKFRGDDIGAVRFILGLGDMLCWRTVRALNYGARATSRETAFL